MSNSRFYVATRNGGTGMTLVEPAHKTLEEARSARLANVVRTGRQDDLSLANTAIYKITFGKVPEFIEGSNLFPEKMQ